MTEFDFEELNRVLPGACIAAFRDLCARHREETIYLAALYTNGPRSFLLPFVLTEQGLDRAVEHYKTVLGYKESHEKLRSILRYMPEDSPYHCEGEAHFSDVNAVMLKAAEAIHSIDTAEDWDEFEAFNGRLDESLCAGLRAADLAGVFEASDRRDLMTLTVMMGDQDDTVFDFARALNSDEAVSRFLRDWPLDAGD
jgi:hypothetical protein